MVRPALPARPERLSQLRTATGTARRRLTVGVVAVLGIAAGACGGSSVSVDVPRTTPVLTVPTGTTPTDDGASTTSTTSTSTTSTSTTDTTAQAPAQSQTPAQSSTPAPQQQQAQPDSSSGGAAPQSSQPAQTQAQTAPSSSGGTGGAEFDDFCKQSPGAC